ncbi:MAG: SPASM domain-containing protein, partial [Mariprofundaceae bacterium]|nr:SPASM domain-containing protein [Mariprofundaceae bacterium]
AMRRVQQAGLPLRVGIILMPENKGSEDASIAFLQEEMGLDTSRIGIDVVRSTGRGAFMRDYKPDMSRLQAFSHRPDSLQHEDNHKSDTQAEDTQNERSHSPTGRRGKLCIGASGNVYPCIFSRNSILGNIRQQSLPDMLAGLDSRAFKTPSSKRWQQCREGLSCSDCQTIAYLLEDHSIPITPVNKEDKHATA